MCGARVDNGGASMCGWLGAQFPSKFQIARNGWVKQQILCIGAEPFVACWILANPFFDFMSVNGVSDGCG